MKVNPLRIMRTQKGITQNELSRLAEVPHYKLSMFENGILKLKPEELRRLSQVLKTDLSNPF
jgi:transcriptional regulator with XRE-family HTH domain